MIKPMITRNILLPLLDLMSELRSINDNPEGKPTNNKTPLLQCSYQ
jgi:hypothetical protein